MKRVRLLLTVPLIALLVSSCINTDDGIGVGNTGPSIEVCLNGVTDVQAEEMKEKIAAQPYKHERLERAKDLGEDRCFQAHQVVVIMEGFTFEDAKLEIAKFLYTRTENRQDYDIVIDELVYLSHRQELRDYIDSIG